MEISTPPRYAFGVVQSPLPVSGRRVVVIDPSFLGDAVFDAPLVRALATAGAAEIALVVRPPADAVARGIPGLARVHVYDKRGADAGLAGLRRTARALAAHQYQVALIPHPSIRSRFLARLAGIPIRAGDGRGLGALLLTHRRHLAGLGFVAQRLALLDPALALRAEARVVAGGLSASPPAPSTRRRIGLLLGAQWATKRWPVEQAERLLAPLDRARFQVLALGSTGERSLYAPLLERGLVEDGTGGTVDELLARLAGCEVVLGGDTGPLHMARALGVPVIALFGPTSEAAHDFAPRDRVLFESLACRPCSAHGPPTCPLGHHRCMRELSAERVSRALSEVLEAGR